MRIVLVRLMNCGTTPVNMFEVKDRYVRRLRLIKLGMLPVKPIFSSPRILRLVREPMTVGILTVLVHEEPWIESEVTLLFEHLIPLQLLHQTGVCKGMEVL